MEIMERIYAALVNRVPGIRERYKKKRDSAKGRTDRAAAWFYLLGMNISYYLFQNRKLKESLQYPYYEEKTLYAEGSESSLSKREPPHILAGRLAEYDVVSFDVFDTLVFRPFSDPTDLFFLVGDRLGYPDFKRIRAEMEWKAREKKYQEANHYEVNLDEIYSMLSKETGIDKDLAMHTELELEYELCFANPYMFRVVQELHKFGKRIIVTSDMYLDTEQIKTLLSKCGYAAFDGYYVSCDQMRSKNKGDLYEYVKEQEGRTRTFVHIGDNYRSDIGQAKKKGFVTEHYVNVNEAGKPFRAEDMSVITGGVYRGLVNAHIHNGLQTYSKEYEYGYIYGGLFVTGYCQEIHRYVKEHRIEKILFLARDGDVLKKAYEILYPEEAGQCEYIYWSRLAATKLGAGYFKYDYFRRFLHHKINQKYTIRQILSSMELEDMLPEMCDRLHIAEDTFLTDKNADKIREYLIQVWEEVLKHYKEQLAAGKLYFSEKLANHHRAVAVDIGWAGSGAIVLNYIVNYIWNMDCEITGLIAGTNTCHNAEKDASETFLQSGRLTSYLYSQRENRDLWKYHDPAKDHNLYWELLLDAPMGSFKGFYPDGQGGYACRFKEAKADIQKVNEIQAGILEFTRQYKAVQEKIKPLDTISGRDAYAPMVNVESGKNRKYMEKVHGLMDEMNL